MFQKLIEYWRAYMEYVNIRKQAYKGQSIDKKAQSYQDISNINWLAIAVSKVANLACTEATFEIESDSSLIEPLKALCEDVEANRFDIVSGMLGNGDYYVLPSTNDKGDIYHSYLDASRVKILDSDGDKIKKIAAIIDYAQSKNGTNTFYLQRIHELDDNGTLTISYQTVNEQGKPVKVDFWGEIDANFVMFGNANHIGIGRYKSPVSSRGLSTIYGVPLNFGCGEIEKQLFETLQQIDREFANAESAVMTDARNIDTDARTGKFKKIDRIIPLKNLSGADRNFEIFNPTIRSSEHFDKLQQQLAMYERQMGLSKGIFTENEALKDGTATAVRRSNADTISFIDAVHSALDDGNKMTLEADAVFLNLRGDLWEYSSDYFDPFADAQEQFNNLLAGHNAGAVSKERLTRWLMPSLTDEQIEEELAKAGQGTQSSIEAMLNL